MIAKIYNIIQYYSETEVLNSLREQFGLQSPLCPRPHPHPNPHPYLCSWSSCLCTFKEVGGAIDVV